jgi:hypothetical protein
MLRIMVFDGASYEAATSERVDFGRAHASMRLRTMQPMATSVCWASNDRARSRLPMMALYRPIAVSTRDRLP